MTGSDERQVRRAIRACRSAGLPVIEPGDCSCGLSGHLVVLARPDGLRLYGHLSSAARSTLPAGGKRPPHQSAPLAPHSQTARRTSTHQNRAGDDPRRPRSGPERRGSSSTPCSVRTPYSPDVSTKPISGSRRRTIGCGGACIPTAWLPSTGRTPVRSTSRSPSTAPKCSALRTRSRQSNRSTGKSTRHSTPTRRRRGTPAARRQHRRAHPTARRCPRARGLVRAAGP